MLAPERLACALLLDSQYRNFPQARIPGMVDDVHDAISWVLANAARLGGGPDEVTLVGQSAGAHLSAMVLLSRYRAATSLPRIRRFIGISGPCERQDTCALPPACKPASYR